MEVIKEETVVEEVLAVVVEAERVIGFAPIPGKFICSLLLIFSRGVFSPLYVFVRFVLNI